MTEHSKDELKRQLDAALSRAAEAQRDATVAQKRYNDAVIAERMAELAARGIVPGVKVNSSAGIHFFGGFEVSPYGAVHAYGYRVKKDGTQGAVKTSLGWYGGLELAQ